MENNTFEIVSEVIRSRRTTKPLSMNGKIIPDETVQKLLELADWAPTHGRTEPWRFFVYSGEALKKFGQTHADLYWQNTQEEKRDPTSPEKLKNNVEKPSHLIIAAMKRGSNPKIPQIEEIAAASAAVQNILLGATALGIVSMWNSGGMTHHSSMKDHLGLGEEDIILGLIYLGYTDEPAKEGRRMTPTEEKVKWME